MNRDAIETSCFIGACILAAIAITAGVAITGRRSPPSNMTTRTASIVEVTDAAAGPGRGVRTFHRTLDDGRVIRVTATPVVVDGVHCYATTEEYIDSDSAADADSSR